MQSLDLIFYCEEPQQSLLCTHAQCTVPKVAG
jgi:hypothetical protein